MLIEIFKSVLLISAVGGALAMFWLCLAPVSRKIFSPRWQYYIWITVLIVMILPVRFSVSEKTTVIPDIISEQTGNIMTEIPKSDNPTADFKFAEQSVNTAIPKINLSWNAWYYLANAWLFGMIAAVMVNTVKYKMFLGAIYKNSERAASVGKLPKRLRVRRTDMLDAPLIVGLIKPTLYLPNVPLSENDMNYVLMHELTHYKRGDLWYKWLAMAVRSIHWFNPLVYIVSKQIDLECEISCDFAVTGKLSESEKNNYMRVILELLSRSKGGMQALTTQMASGKRTLKRRFTMIRNKKATSKFVSVISAVTAVIMLSTSVFASGILSDMVSDTYTIEVYNGEHELSLKNAPFIYDGEYYLPLREILNGFDLKDITYSNGEITVKIPTERAKDETDIITIKTGNALIYHGKTDSESYGVVMRCAPVVYNNTIYVTVDYFEDLMKIADMPGFRLNVIRPTNPENYYTKGERVFIGTAEEQDNYSGELVKRIIVDENGEVIAVIPIENQISQNVDRKYEQAEKGAIFDSFYQAVYNQAYSGYDFRNNSLYESDLLFVERENTYIAYINVADIIKIPQTEFNKDLHMTITNTYADK